MTATFLLALKNAGWREIQHAVCYRKGSWQIVFDTSSWMEIGTAKTARLFDVPVPEASLETWTVKLIEHLCETDDLR